MACEPPPMSSDQVIQGVVAVFGTSVPAATRGSSASCATFLFSEHFSSPVVSTAQGPKPCVPDVSSGKDAPAVPLPTATQWKTPEPGAVWTALAANTISFECRPIVLPSCSYHTTQGTVSFGPVNASSGSTPS